MIWHNGAIDSYRADLALRTARGVGVIVLTNFGNANTEAFADRALAVLEATGAMKPREPVFSDRFTPALTTFLEVYNDFDATKLASILGRPMDPREPEELAGYKALHGTCTAFAPVKMLANGAARFAFTCERGHFELDVAFDGTGKIGGFIGRSSGVAPPPAVRTLFLNALALHINNRRWNAATYKRVFPKHQIPEAQARGVAAKLRTQFGTCRTGAFRHEGFGWTLALACSKGGPLELSIQFDPHGDLQGIQFHPPMDSEPPRCPLK
jgi:hypothetical protein